MPDAVKPLLWIWRNLQLCLPPDWEMLQFSREEAQGRCAFADARQFRLELSWAVVPKPPDLPRLMSDYTSKLEKNKTLFESAPAKIAGWHGVIGQQKEHPMSRFGFYHEAGRLLTELVFLWPNERDKVLESTILHSCRLLTPGPNEPIRWRAFGMDLLVPSDYRMTDCHIQPACAQITFAPAKKRRPDQLRVQRLGMVKSWLDVPLDQWMQRQAPPCLVRRQTQTLPHEGIERATMTGLFKPKGILHRNGNYRAACWIDPSDERLYFIESITRIPAPALNHLLTRLHPAT